MEKTKPREGPGRTSCWHPRTTDPVPPARGAGGTTGEEQLLANGPPFWSKLPSSIALYLGPSMAMLKNQLWFVLGMVLQVCSIVRVHCAAFVSSTTPRTNFRPLAVQTRMACPPPQSLSRTEPRRRFDVSLAKPLGLGVLFCAPPRFLVPRLLVSSFAVLPSGLLGDDL